MVVRRAGGVAGSVVAMSTPSATELVERFRGLRVLAVGGALLDTYHCGRVERICREAPVPLLSVERRVDSPGGAANAAANAAALGAHVDLVSAVGDDDAGMRLRDALADIGVECAAMVVQPGWRTPVKNRLVCGSHLLMRFDEDPDQPVDFATIGRICTAVRRLGKRCDVIVVSEYGHGIACTAVLQALAAVRRDAPWLPVILDSRGMRGTPGVPTVVKVNRREAEQILGLPRGAGDVAAMRVHALSLRAVLDAEVAVVTMDRDGVLVAARDGAVEHVAARPTHAAGHTTGAGDTFVAALSLAMAAGADERTAARIGAAAAGVVVSRDGTSVCTAQELLQCVGEAADRGGADGVRTLNGTPRRRLRSAAAALRA